jgi:hypothetical protein
MSTRRTLLTALLVLVLLAPGASAAPAEPAASPTAPAPASAPAAPGDEYWAAGFHLLGMNDFVYALAFGPDGSLFADGHFTTDGRVAANYIARWDGPQWHPLGSGTGCYVSTPWRLGQMARSTLRSGSAPPAGAQPAASPAGMALSGMP